MGFTVRHQTGLNELAAQAYQTGANEAARQQAELNQKINAQRQQQAMGYQADLQRTALQGQIGYARDAQRYGYQAYEQQGKDAEAQRERDFKAQNYADLREHQLGLKELDHEQEMEFQDFKEAAPERARARGLADLDRAESELYATRDQFEDDQFADALSTIKRRRSELKLSAPKPTPEEQQAQMQQEFMASSIPDPNIPGVRWTKNKNGEWQQHMPPKGGEDPAMKMEADAQKQQAQAIEKERVAREKKQEAFRKFFRERRVTTDAEGNEKTRSTADIKKEWEEEQKALDEVFGPEEVVNEEAGQGQRVPDRIMPGANATAGIMPRGPSQPGGGAGRPQPGPSQQGEIPMMAVDAPANIPPQYQQMMQENGQQAPAVISKPADLDAIIAHAKKTGKRVVYQAPNGSIWATN